MDVRVKIGDSMLNIVGLNFSTHYRLVQFYALTCSIQFQFAVDRKQLAMRLTVHEKRIQFHDPCLNRSGEMDKKLSKAAFSAVFFELR